MSALKAWDINDFETWAGVTLDEAIEAAMAANKANREDVFTAEYEC